MVVRELIGGLVSTVFPNSWLQPWQERFFSPLQLTFLCHLPLLCHFILNQYSPLRFQNIHTKKNVFLSEEKEIHAGKTFDTLTVAFSSKCQ